MAQWVRYLATKPEDFSLILRTDRVNIINSCNYSLNATCALWYVSLSTNLTSEPAEVHRSF